MKMSDVFELPLNCGLVDNVDVGYAIELEPEKSVTDEQAFAVDYAINNHDQLTEENEKLRHELANLIYMAENNTGHEPSLSCFHLAINEAKQLLLTQLKDKNNDE